MIVLASGSETRAALLRNAGIDVIVDPPRIDEDAIKQACADRGGSVEQAAETLAEMKATRVSPRHPGAMVVGADQMLDCNGVWFDKPKDRAAAFTQLATLRGKTHRLVTAVTVLRDGRYLWHHVAEARLTMRELDDAALAAYLEQAGDTVLGAVGAYRLEGLGAHLFAKIEGDFFTILGLPLLPLLDFLRNNGVGLK